MNKERLMERTLLLVDDEEGIGAALSRLLRPDGYKILRAHSGQEGLELLAQHKVHVIVSDQRMPEMSGVEFLRRVKELYPNTVRLILSGYADLDSVTDAINRGAIYKFLTKPWDNEMLCANVHEAFRHYELMQQKNHLALEIQEANATLASLSLELSKLLADKEALIEHISHYDQLTNLPNRSKFISSLNQELVRAEREGLSAALILLDLVEFRKINDSFGYAGADQLLQKVAGRLISHARAEDLLARVGGNEFCFLLTGISDARDASAVTQSILTSFEQDPVSVGSTEIYVNICLGISLYPADGLDSNTLINKANEALRRAKDDRPINALRDSATRC
jgi:diguanylate cyclase (GGDEF)-like protein